MSTLMCRSLVIARQFELELEPALARETVHVGAGAIWEEKWVVNERKTGDSSCLLNRQRLLEMPALQGRGEREFGKGCDWNKLYTARHVTVIRLGFYIMNH